MKYNKINKRRIYSSFSYLMFILYLAQLIAFFKEIKEKNPEKFNIIFSLINFISHNFLVERTINAAKAE